MKTICILANGFGVESKSSTYSLSDQKLTPNLNYLLENYLYTTLSSSGLEVGLDNGQILTYETGYRVFSGGKNLSTSFDFLQKLYEEDRLINDSIQKNIDYAKNNNSFLHIIFPVGDRNALEASRHLAYVVFKASEAKVNVKIHLIIGDNIVNKTKKFNDYYTYIKRYLKNLDNWKIVFVSGINSLIDNAGNNAHINVYKMITTTVGEVWEDIETNINNRYNEGLTDEEIAPFLINREKILNDNDSILVFNYNYINIVRYLAIISKPEILFNNNFVTENIYISTLFPLVENRVYEAAYEYPSMQDYFANKFNDYDKKITLIAENTRINYIAEMFSGSKNLSTKFNYKGVFVTNNAFDDIMSIAISEFENGENDIIFVDFDLARGFKDKDPQYIVNNLKSLDRNIGLLKDLIQRKQDNLIITSLYGLKEVIEEEKGYFKLLDMSLKVPFIFASYNYSKNETSIKGDNVAGIASAIMSLYIPKYKGYLSLNKNQGLSKNQKIIIFLIIVIIIIIILNQFMGG